MVSCDLQPKKWLIFSWAMMPPLAVATKSLSFKKKNCIGCHTVFSPSL